MKDPLKKTLTRVLVQDQQALIDLCQSFENSSLLAIDTEFVRTRTLYPRLGLLQVNNGEILALIDPITIADLSPFWQLLSNANICKVLHACSEDLEVFLTAGNCKPVNLIDSQVMMSFLGHGLSMGYAAMIEHFTGVALDKSESRTDWTKRPLTAKQIVYAEADVDFLFQVYPQLLSQLEQSGWLVAAQQETQMMIERKFTPINDQALYKNIKMSWRLNAEQLNQLKFLASWRYLKAKQKNVPIGFIVKDHTLMAVAQNSPQNMGAMSELEGAETLDIKHQGRAMLTVLKEANQAESSTYPKKIMRLDEYPGYKQIFKQVKGFISKTAEESGLSPENLASKKQINQFLTWYFKLEGSNLSTDNIDVLQGWRLLLFGEELQQFALNDF